VGVPNRSWRDEVFMRREGRSKQWVNMSECGGLVHFCGVLVY
jgi:hypothetical protein